MDFLKTKLYKIINITEKTEKSIILLSALLMAVISLIYFYCFGQGIFFYQENRTLFIFSGEYLQKFLIKPGGLLEYAGNFIAQFYYYPFFGSLINSIFLLLFFISILKINRELMSGSFSLLIILTPVIFLFFLQTRYTHAFYNSLGYLSVLLFFLFFLKIRGMVNNYIIISFFPLIYYLTGSFALISLIVIIIYCIIFEKDIHRYMLPLFIGLIAVLSFFVFKEILFYQTGKQLVLYPLPVFQISKLPVLYTILCSYICLFPVLIKLSELLKLSYKTSSLINIVFMIIVFPLVIILLVKNYDQNINVLLRIEKSIFRQDWNAVIKIQEKYQSTNSNAQYYYNLALSEKGQLCSRMFHAPQDFRAKSLTLPREIENLNRSYYFYYTIGLVGEAHHLAYESMVLNGYSPENIKFLIKTELINGNHKPAERYINVLKKTLFYRDQAKLFERMLYKMELVNSDPDLGEKVRLLPRKDFFIVPDDNQNIEMTLMANPQNKRAFEYKMARLLLEKDLKSLIAEVKRMNEMGYTSLPKHVEEAILVYISVTREFPDTGEMKINPDTEFRYGRYLSVFNLNSSNKTKLESEMQKIAGNTFWYYYQFR